jgi:hypothetical protein
LKSLKQAGIIKVQDYSGKGAVISGSNVIA